MKEYIIRNRQNHDLQEILDIWLEINISAHAFIPAEYWKENLDFVQKVIPQAQVCVCENQGEIVGFAGMENHYIAGIFVQKKMQGKGIGKLLLDACKKASSELSLHVYEKNKRAVKFYMREGFKLLEKQVDEHTGEVEYFMKWCKNPIVTGDF